MVDTAIQIIADFVSELAVKDIPEDVRGQARLCLLDTIGCMIAGANTEETTQVYNALAQTEGTGDSIIIGTSKRLSALGAMQCNAYSGDIFELNDLIGGHASIGIISAAIAAAELSNPVVEEFIRALVVGIETTARVYHAFYPHQKAMTDVGMVSVGLSSAVGAAATTAALMKHDPVTIMHALANSAALANWCPAEVIFGDGGTIKPMLFGALPALAGYRGAAFAAAGITGPKEILDGSRGYFATIATDWSSEVLASRDWHLRRPRRKLHACCGYIHSAFDALAMLAADPSFKFELVDSVSVEVPAFILPAIAKSSPPVSANDARFHIQYMLAHAMLGADAAIPAYSLDFRTHISRPEIRKTMAKINVSANNELTHYHQSRASVSFSTGSVVAVENTAPRGSAQRPLSVAELEEKFVSLAVPTFGKANAPAIWTDGMSLADDALIKPFLTKLSHRTEY